MSDFTPTDNIGISLKTGDTVLLTGVTLLEKWYRKKAQIIEIEGRMITVRVVSCGTTLLVFGPEVTLI